MNRRDLFKRGLRLAGGGLAAAMLPGTMAQPPAPKPTLAMVRPSFFLPKTHEVFSSRMVFGIDTGRKPAVISAMVSHDNGATWHQVGGNTGVASVETHTHAVPHGLESHWLQSTIVTRTGQCARCGQTAQLYGSICGSCGDDLNDERKAEEALRERGEPA